MGHWARIIRHKIFVKGNNKWQVLADFVIEFSPWTVSPEQGCLASAHKGVESSGAKSFGIKLAPEGHEVIKEPPQSAEATITGEVTEDPEVNIESP